MHKLAAEALERIRWNGFEKWLLDQDKEIEAQGRLLEHIADVSASPNAERFQSLISCDEFLQVFEIYQQYGDIPLSPMKVFWNSYLAMVSLLQKEGRWKLHLACIRDIMPWMFAYDRVNYSRYLPVYFLQMSALLFTHPEAAADLLYGDFGVQSNSSHGFSQVPVDQAIEQTINRDSKTKGGIIGFSLQKGAVQKWAITAHE